MVVSQLPEGILQENKSLFQENKSFVREKENNDLLQDNNELSQNDDILQQNRSVLQENNGFLQENKSPDVQEENTPLSSNPRNKCYTEEDVREVRKVQVEKFFFKEKRPDCPQPSSTLLCTAMYYTM